jgi:hypothetical protein
MTNSAEATVLEARRLITALGSWLPPTANCTIQQNPQLTKLKQDVRDFLAGTKHMETEGAE